MKTHKKEPKGIRKDRAKCVSCHEYKPRRSGKNKVIYGRNKFVCATCEAEGNVFVNR